MPNSIVQYKFTKGYNINNYFKPAFMKALGLIINKDTQPRFQILELRIYHPITKPKIISELLSFLKYNTKLRDLELTFESTDPIKKVFEALSSNFMIKTVRLHSEEAVSDEIIELADNFSSQRIAVDIKLNTSNKKYKASENRISEFHYPDEF